MTNVLIIGSLDRFGSECVASLHGYLRESGRYKGLVHREIVHVWMGGGVEPSHPEHHCGSNLPLWTECDGKPASLGLPEVKVSSQFDRKQYSQVTGDQIGAPLGRILTELPDGMLGRGQYGRVTLALVGSGADPRSTATALAVLRNLFDDPILSASCVPSLFLSLNSESASKQEFEGEAAMDVMLNSFAGLNLREIEAFLAPPGGAAGRGRQPPLAPVFLSGNSTWRDQRLTREDSRVEIAGALIGLTQSLFHEREEPFSRLFDFGYAGDRPHPRWMNQPFDPKRPFALIGAATVVCKRELLLDIVGFRVCERVFDFYKARNGSAGDAPPADYLAEMEQTLVRRTQQRLETLGYRSGETGSSTAFSSDWLDCFLGWKSLSSGWRDKVNSAFGWERIEDIPLEYWEQSLAEFKQVTEAYFAAERQRFFQLFGRDFLHAVDAALDESFNDLCLKSWNVPVGFRPSQAARHFITHLRDSLKAHQMEWNRQELKAVEASEDLADFKAQAESEEKGLLEAIKLLPSRLALWLRAIPLMGLAILVSVSVPVGESGFWVWLKLGLGAAAGAGLIAFIHSRVVGPRRRLRELFANWLQAYCQMLEQQMQADFRAWKRRFYEMAVAYCEWLLQPPDENLPPLHKHPVLKEFVQPFRTDQAPTTSLNEPKHEFLFHFLERLEQAQRVFANLALESKGFFHLSKLETSLPRLSPKPDDFNREDRLIEWSHQEEFIKKFLDDVFQFATNEPSEAFLPFSARKSASNPQGLGEWVGDFKMIFAAPAALESFRKAPVGLMFGTVRRYLGRNMPAISSPEISRQICVDYYSGKSWAEVNPITDGDGEFWKLNDLSFAKISSDLKTPDNSCREILGPVGLPRVLVGAWKPNQEAYQHLPAGELLVLIEGVTELDANLIIYGAGGIDLPNHIIGVCLNKMERESKGLACLRPAFEQKGDL